MKRIVFYNLILAGMAVCLVLYIIAPQSGLGKSEQPDAFYLAASSKQASEYKIKAVYLYNFLLFASWPNEDNDGKVGDVCIGIVGQDPFGDSFAEIEGKVIKSLGKKLVIKRYGSYARAKQLDDCKLLFVCSSERGDFSKILEEIDGSRTLTVADVDGFLKSGGMINLVKVKKIFAGRSTGHR